jgi:hypothetical protein
LSGCGQAEAGFACIGLKVTSIMVYALTMSVEAKKVAEILAWPAQDRAFLARELIASLDPEIDADTEAQWEEVLERRGREINQGTVTCRSVEEVVKDVRANLNARRRSS